MPWRCPSKEKDDPLSECNATPGKLVRGYRQPHSRTGSFIGEELVPNTLKVFPTLLRLVYDPSQMVLPAGRARATSGNRIKVDRLRRTVRLLSGDREWPCRPEAQDD